jgi:hypothetical protein
MCLGHVTITYTKPLQEIREGYKVFVIQKNGDLNNLYYPRDKNFHIGDTLIDKCDKSIDLSDNNYDHYPNGFHIYHEKSGARNERMYRTRCYKICRVLYTSIVAEGTQRGYKCDVARRMTILEICK